jgi:hypothetical protein
MQVADYRVWSREIRGLQPVTIHRSVRVVTLREKRSCVLPIEIVLARRSRQRVHMRPLSCCFETARLCVLRSVVGIQYELRHG